MMRPNPLVFETHTRVFLNRLSAQYSRRVTLGDIPDDEWGRLASMGFDGVWLMGVWQRSEAARRVALVHENLRDEYGRALPGWGEGDVEASPYAVHGYTVDSTLGDAGSLAIVQEQLHRHGLSLIVDFVPNHLALDHPWTGTHPSRFVMPSPQQAHEHPDWYFTTEAGHVLAHGRDPYFGPWEDTAQVDFFSEDLRSAWTEQLLEMASIADGVRCDMAMLGMNRIFEWLWGEVSLHPRPADEFWEKAIGAVKAKYPDFVFIAEAYWDTETELRALGFDYTYDKHLYDRLRWEDGAAVGEYLSNQAELGRWVRFVENHDEARAVEVFGRERSFAAATIATSLPGLRLFYDGQIEGRTTRMPVQVARWPDEIVDVGLHAAYQTLLATLAAEPFRSGAWRPLRHTLQPREGGGTQNVLAWEWTYAEKSAVVIVNYSPIPASITTTGSLEDSWWLDVLEAGTAPFHASDGIPFGPWQARLLVPGIQQG